MQQIHFLGMKLSVREYKALIACTYVVIGCVFLLMPEMALAEKLPWETPLCDVALSLSGPTASAVAVIVIVATGLLIAAGEAGGIFKTLLTVLFGLAVALLSAKWLGFIDAQRASQCIANN